MKRIYILFNLCTNLLQNIFISLIYLKNIIIYKVKIKQLIYTG